MEMNKCPITVADLDSITPVYKVVDEDGRNIGEKIETRLLTFNRALDEKFVYLKPKYAKNGRRLGGKRGSTFEDRAYRTAPPWLKYEVFKIDRLDGHVALHVRK